ncbi:MAG: S9 family peptidase [Gemmatimonadota bacterium]|nr:MAG: S9 family peptidase [Gemmatimonadota bacterium]
MRTGTFFLGLLTLVLSLPSVTAAQAPAGTLALETYLDWETVRGPQVSPDGSQIVFTRGWVDKVNDRRRSSIWIMNADGSRSRVLTEGSSPIWSPDGTRVAFLDEGQPDGRQVFVRWMDAEGATTQITRVENSPGNVRWSPDGTQISFTMSVDSDNSEWNVKLPSRPEGAEWTKAPKVVSRLNYKRDRRGFIDDGYTHIFVVPAEGGTPRQLTDGDWNHGGPEWMPDGKSLVFTSLRVEDAEYMWRESEIYSVSVADGRLIAYQGQDWSEDTYREPGLYVMNADGSNARQIAGELGRGLANVTWAEDGSGVFFNASMKGTSNFWFAPVNGEPRQVTQGNHMLRVSSIDARGDAVGTRSSYYEPGDLIAFNVDRPSDIRQLTNVNADVLMGVKLGEVEEIWYKSVDDFDIQGWIIKPPNFDPNRAYPMMLAIHGGPHGMYGVGFNFGWQNHAANGYVVLYTNPRGSSGYGSAFGNSIKNADPGFDFDDLMAGVDLVVDRGYIDEDNMFVYGCSGGGVLTSWIVGHTDRFAAASANCPVTNWLSFVGTTDGASWYNNFEEYPWDDPSEHLRRSPLMYVGNVSTPTMLMTGENDLRTPMGQTEEFYQALKVLKVPTLMVRYKDEWHGTSSNPSNFLRTQLFQRKWFKKWENPKAITQ